MKKLIILLAICFCAINTFAQDTYRISSTTMGNWNSYSNSYDWGEYNDVDMTLTLKGMVMFISDKAKSVYILKSVSIDKTIKGVKHFGWYAVDEQNIRCTVKICTYPSGTKMIYVMYSDMGFGYTLDQ